MADFIRKTLLNTASPVMDGAFKATFCISKGEPDLEGDLMDQATLDFSAMLKNGVGFFNHDSNHILGTWSNFRRVGNSTYGTLTFAPAGVSQKADEVRGLIKAGIVKGASLGGTPGKTEPVNSSDRSAGRRFLIFKVFEISVVSIPCVPDATLVSTEGKAFRPGAGDGLNGPAAKAARMRRAAELQRQGATKAGLPVDPTDMTREQAERIVKAERLANGETWQEVNAPTTRSMTEQERASKHAAEAFLRLDSNTQEARLRKAAAMAEEPGARERRVREAELALAQRQAFQRQYGRDAS